MANALDVVSQVSAGDAGRGSGPSRQYPCEDLSLVGPLHAFKEPRAYLQALGKLHTIIAFVDVTNAFVGGNDVYLLYGIVTTTPVGTSFVAEWYHLKNCGSATIRDAFDARPWALRSAGLWDRFAVAA